MMALAMGEFGRRRVVVKFDWASVAARVTDVLEAVVAGRTGTR